MNGKIKIWDKVAELYDNTVSDGEKEFSNSLIKIFKDLKLSHRSSLIELGSGSGHLSGLISKAGYHPTLFDFSSMALIKSQDFFSKYGFKGSFIKGDILAINKNLQKYDLVWNSGVMEHFNDKELLQAFQNIRKITKKFFIFIVPNPNSLPYLLFRFKLMREGKWTFGKEYLRDSYEKLLEQSGFKMLEKRCIGSNFTNYFINLVFGINSGSSYFHEMLAKNLIPENSFYLTVYLAKPIKTKRALIKGEYFSKNKQTEQRTNRFDRIAQGTKGMVRKEQKIVSNLVIFAFRILDDLYFKIFPPKINSKKWWDNYFKQEWDKNKDSQQTLFFCKLLYKNLPQKAKNDISLGNNKILDFGCAYGQCPHFLKSKFPESNFTGMDFTKRAISTAKKNYKDCEFICGSEKNLNTIYDVIITSNTIEHFTDPLKIINTLVRHCRLYLIILVPYKEDVLHYSHFTRFTYKSFPEKIYKFSKFFTKVSDTSKIKNTYWPGKQILVIYKKN